VLEGLGQPAAATRPPEEPFRDALCASAALTHRTDSLLPHLSHAHTTHTKLQKEKKGRSASAEPHPSAAPAAVKEEQHAKPEPDAPPATVAATAAPPQQQPLKQEPADGDAKPAAESQPIAKTRPRRSVKQVEHYSPGAADTLKRQISMRKVGSQKKRSSEDGAEDKEGEGAAAQQQHDEDAEQSGTPRAGRAKAGSARKGGAGQAAMGRRRSGRQTAAHLQETTETDDHDEDEATGTEPGSPHQQQHDEGQQHGGAQPLKRQLSREQQEAQTQQPAKRVRQAQGGGDNAAAAAAPGRRAPATRGVAGGLKQARSGSPAAGQTGPAAGKQEQQPQKQQQQQQQQKMPLVDLTSLPPAQQPFARAMQQIDGAAAELRALLGQVNTAEKALLAHRQRLSAAGTELAPQLLAALQPLAQQQSDGAVRGTPVGAHLQRQLRTLATVLDGSPNFGGDEAADAVRRAAALFNAQPYPSVILSRQQLYASLMEQRPPNQPRHSLQGSEAPMEVDAPPAAAPAHQAAADAAAHAAAAAAAAAAPPAGLPEAYAAIIPLRALNDPARDAASARLAAHLLPPCALPPLEAARQVERAVYELHERDAGGSRYRQHVDAICAVLGAAPAAGRAPVGVDGVVISCEEHERLGDVARGCVLDGLITVDQLVHKTRPPHQ